MSKDEVLNESGGHTGHGFWQRWNAAGAVIDEGDVDHGSKIGQWTYFTPDGTVKRTTLHRGRGT